MFKKFIALMMVMSIFTVSAHATTQDGLKQAFDEMTYNLTVEWDQKNQDVYQKEMKKFMAAVSELQAKGLTNAQMVEFAKSQVKDAQAAKDLETAFNMITITKMTTEEASQYMMETMKRTYSKGASWNGEALYYIAAGLLIIGLGVAIAAGGGGRPSNGCYWYDVYCYDYWGYSYYCGQEYSCY